jgi:hypothetical protein
VSFEAQGEQMSYFLANKWNQPNGMMRDIDSGNDVVSIIPQDEVLNLDIKFYFSRNHSIREDALEKPSNASNKFHPLIVIPFFSTPFSFGHYPVGRETTECAKELPGLYYIRCKWGIGTRSFQSLLILDNG